MSATAHLAIDLGAESGRAILGGLDGDRLTLEELHRFPNRTCRLPGGLHWDLPGLWAGVQDGVRRAETCTRDRGMTLASLGVDTWGVDYGLLDAGGALLGLPRCYRDSRTAAVFDRLRERPGEERLYDATGIECMAINTLIQLYAQIEHEPGVVAAADRLLFMPDLIGYLLTGAKVAEASIASTSQMVDPRTGDWATSLLDELGLPARLLAPIVPSGTRIGALLPHVADAVESDGDVTVIASAAHDTASAVAAVPAALDTEWCYLSSGTWSLLGAELDAPCLTPAARAARFTNERGVAETIRFHRNIAGLWLVQECRRDLAGEGVDHEYTQLAELAAAATPFRTLIDPAHPPFAAPGRMREKIERFAQRTGQPAPEDAGQLVRACLESLAYAYRHALEQLESVLGRSFSVIHLVGGGGRNRLLNQMTADATGRRVIVGPVEATAVGNILVQAMGKGVVRDLAHLRSIVTGTFEPEAYEPRDAATWDRHFPRYRIGLDLSLD